jgi:hypothetical protein
MTTWFICKLRQLKTQTSEPGFVSQAPVQTGMHGCLSHRWGEVGTMCSQSVGQELSLGNRAWLLGQEKDRWASREEVALELQEKQSAGALALLLGFQVLPL